ncbi:unnamed protein product [Closterium sp. NIES-65]|nr:unnamed protein product [Closterium sp. NIES-65]
MAEAVAVMRAKKKAAANGEREAPVLTRSESLLDEKFDVYEAANYRMWARSKSEAFSRRKPSGSRSRKKHDLDFLDSHGFAPQNAEIMTRVEASSFNPSEGDEGDDDDDGRFGGDCAESGAEEGRAGGEGLGTEGARDSSGNSSHKGAADDERGLRGFLRQCRPRTWRASSTRSDESCTDGAEGAGGGEGKAAAAGAFWKRSMTADSMGGASLARSTSDALQDAEMDEMDREVLQEAFVRVVGLQQRVQHYRDLGGFVVLMALFITILYLQADSSRSYEITAAHAVLFPPGMSQDSANTFAGLDDFYNWLNTSIVQSLWADPTCGDGSCDRPFQFPAFGRFGCEADCGTFPNLTTVVVRFSSHLDTQQAVDGSSWNLCMVDPVSLCWYESFQPFPRGEAEVSVALDIPDGDWVVVLNAPAGGIRGNVHAPPPGTQRLAVVGAASTIELAAWGSCALEDDVDAANQTQPGGGVAGAAPDICRDTCARLVACLPATCGRAFTEREVAGAFVDCARMCIVAPSSITTFASSPCPMVRSLPHGALPAPWCAPCPMLRSLPHAALPAPWWAPCPMVRPLPHGVLPAPWFRRNGSFASKQPPQVWFLTACSHSALAPPFAPAITSLHIFALPPCLFEPLLPNRSPSLSFSQAVYRFHHSHSYERWPVSTATGPPDASSPPAAAGVHALAAPAASSSAASASDQQRLTVLQVAVSRALFTMAKDRCLAGHGPGSKRSHTLGGPGSVRWHVVATLCTILGGPVTTMDECRMYGADGKQVMTLADMYAYLKYRHTGHVISAQHMVRWVQTVAAAVSSVTPVPDVAAARLNALMHSFNDAIISSNAVGCSQGGAWLQWRVGVKHNTTIHVGDKVTWLWDDDLPHSLKVAGMGEVDDPLFLGFGGHRLAVSRKLACTPLNVGNGDAFDEPMPCVLKIDDGAPGSFAYSKVFEEPITIHYEDGTLSVDDSSSSSSPATSAASLLTVLPARAGAEVAGGVNATDSTTLSSTARFTSTNTSIAGTTNTTTAATYECSPGCRLQRLANGVCDAACNTPACAFDGGDCACVDPLFGPGICPCPPGHTRRDDGSCCLSTAVGANLNFPFSLQRYGPNYTESNFAFAAERGFAATRFVSHRNRLLIGLVLQQDRWGTQQCNGSGLLHLAGWCSNGTSREPFGVNPHFLPTSAIYDSAASANMSQFDNNTLNPQNLPYGFIYPVDSLTVYPLVFDINLDYEAAMRRLHYLVDGSYIDNGTRTVDVSFISFNGETLTFVLTTVSCKVTTGGSMAVSIKSQPAAMAMYDASADNIARLVLEVVYLVGLLWNVCGELQEMADRAAIHGSVLSYFSLVWNWVDMLSLTLQVTAVVIWVVLWRYVEAFDMQPRYDIYYTLLEMPRYWAVPNPPTGFISATQAFADLRNIINLRGIYFSLQGINLFFMMIRLLKVMDFQPYLGVITRSLALATPSLMHFFLLSFTVFFCFSMYAYLVFGGALEMFSTVLESMFSCFLLLLNDNGSAYFFQRMESWDLIAAMLFFFMFIVFMVFILLNFLIAIIVDAFMSVKDSNLVATSIVADLAHIFKYKWNCWHGRYLPYPLILDRLVELGAKDTRVDESMKGRTRAIFSCSCGGGCKPAHLDCAENHPTFPSASQTGERLQHVLTVREKRIDVISLSMILQRRQDRERVGPYKAESPYKCFPRAASRECADDEQLDQLSQAVVLQCGEVVKQAALPVKKSAKKLSLAHLKEDLARSEAKVEELSAMMTDMHALMLDLLARTPPLGNTAHSPGTPGGLPALSSMPRAYTEPPRRLMSLADSPPPLEQAGSRREVLRRFSESGGGGGPDEGEKRAGATRDGWSPAGGSSSRTPVQVSPRLSESGTGGEAFRGEKRVGGARDSPSSAGGSSSRTPVQASRVLGRRVSWQDGRGAAAQSMADHPDAIERPDDPGDEPARRSPIDLSAAVTGLDLLFSNLAAVDNHGKAPAVAPTVDVPFEPIDEPLCPSPTAPVLEQDSSNPSGEEIVAVPVAKKSARYTQSTLPWPKKGGPAACCLSTAVGANLNFPFSLQRYGPNYTESNFAFAAERGFAATRFVSHRNRLLIGLVLQQDRWGTQQCNGSGLLHLAGWCSNGTSREPFGVNPHFLPTSAIYDSAASANMNQLDNNTLNPQNLPYGFIYPVDSLTVYPLVFDINLDYEAAMRRLHYLVDGSYIDNGTRTVDVSFISETLTFVLTTVSCKVTTGGSMAVSIKSQPAAMAMYDASADNIARLMLEVVYLVGLLWNVCGELQEMADRAAIHGSVLSYFSLVWNWVDMLSLTLQVTAVVIWVVLWRYVEAFDMQPRYDIYYTLLEMPRYWAVPNPPTGFISATQAFADLRNIINLRGIYFSLQGINLFFMMIRLLKVMDFQPYLGVITRSLALATPSLMHFFLLSFTVFFCFSMYAYLVFGGALEMFSTVLESMFSWFLLLLNDNGSAYFFQQMESWDLIAAMLFFFMFIVFMVFILLNFLIAIIVDAFMSVKDSNLVATSIVADLTHIFKYKWNCWRGRYLPYPLILDRLVELGAKDTRVDEQSLLQSDRRMRRMQSMKGRTRAIFSCSFGGGCKPSHLDCAENHPTFPSAGQTGERLQHVLTVREKRIDVISLSMILQRRQDRERVGPYKAESPYKCFPRAASRECADDEQLDQLSQAVVLQCGEVVKKAALPAKKSAKKLSLAHLKEDLARSEAKVEELSAMMTDMHALMLDLLARTPPLGNTAHSPGTPGGLPALSSMPRAYTEPPWCQE